MGVESWRKEHSERGCWRTKGQALEMALAETAAAYQAPAEPCICNHIQLSLFLLPFVLMCCFSLCLC